jgi:hypothetical protein
VTKKKKRSKVAPPSTKPAASRVAAVVEAKPKAAKPVPASTRAVDWRTVTLGAAVSLAALILYLLTAARDVVTGDTAEFLVAARTLGVAHAPGYPLLTVLGHVFSWFPVGSTAFRIGLLAVVCSTATVATVFATVWRLTSLRAPAAAAGLALAFTPLFWRWSLQMETFPLDNLLAALVVYLLVRWHQEPGRRTFLFGAAFAFGLGITNQQTIVLLVPAIVWMLWLHRRQLVKEWSTIGLAALAVVAGLAPYVYVPIAALGHSPDNWDYVHSVPAFARLLLRTDFGGLGAQGNAAATGSNVAVRAVYLVRGIGVVVGVFSLLGIVTAYRRCRWYFWFVVLAVAASGGGFLLETNLDPTSSTGIFVLERFFLLPLVIVAPLVGFGVMWSARLVADHRPSVPSHRAAVAVASVVAAASLIVVGVNYSTLNVSGDHVAGNYSRDALEGLRPHTILFATDDFEFTTLYMTSVARVRPDVTVVLANLFPTTWYTQVLRHNHQINVPAKVTTLNIIRANPGRPIAFEGPAPDTSIDGKYYLYPDGLVSYLERVGHPILVTRDEADNEAQLARVHVPGYRTLKPDSFEGEVLNAYAAIPFRIGQAYALAGQKSEALLWYRRTLAMDPSLTVAAQAARKLGGTP